MAAHQRLVVGCERLGENRDVAAVAAVAEGDRRIPGKPTALCARYRGAEVGRAEPLVGHSKQPVQRRERVVERRRRHLGVVGDLRRLRVGAHVLADVTAVDPVAHLRSQLAGNPATLFDRQERDAGRRVNRVGVDDRAGRALVQADAAAAAIPVERGVGQQRDVEHQLAEQHPRAVTGNDDARMLPIPAESGAGGDGALHHPRGVDEEAGLDFVAEGLLEIGVECLHPFLDNAVVVATPRIARNAAATHAVVRLFQLPGPVRQPDGEDRFRGRVEVADVLGDVNALVGEPVHAGEVTGVDAVVHHGGRFRERIDAGYGADAEAVVGGGFLHPGGGAPEVSVVGNRHRSDRDDRVGLHGESIGGAGRHQGHLGSPGSCALGILLVLVHA